MYICQTHHAYSRAMKQGTHDQLPKVLLVITHTQLLNSCNSCDFNVTLDVTVSSCIYCTCIHVCTCTCTIYVVSGDNLVARELSICDWNTSAQTTEHVPHKIIPSYISQTCSALLNWSPALADHPNACHQNSVRSQPVTEEPCWIVCALVFQSVSLT